jgi:hypothetical protein
MKHSSLLNLDVLPQRMVAKITWITTAWIRTPECQKHLQHTKHTAIQRFWLTAHTRSEGWGTRVDQGTHVVVSARWNNCCCLHEPEVSMILSDAYRFTVYAMINWHHVNWQTAGESKKWHTPIKYVAWWIGARSAGKLSACDGAYRHTPVIKIEWTISDVQRTDAPNCVFQRRQISEIHDEIMLDKMYRQCCMSSLKNPGGACVLGRQYRNDVNLPDESYLGWQCQRNQ